MDLGEDSDSPLDWRVYRVNFQVTHLLRFTA